MNKGESMNYRGGNFYYGSAESTGITEQGVKYRVDDVNGEKTICIVDYLGSLKKIEIPREINLMSLMIIKN